MSSFDLTPTFGVEGTFTPDNLVYEEDTLITRQVTLVSGENRTRGAVLGRTATAGTAVAAASSGNTGNGTCSAVTTGGRAIAGVYKVLFIEPTTNLGTFEVIAPDGKYAGRGVVGTAFSGAVNFTISDGATDFVAGDGFDITVTAITYKYKLSAAAATDGSEVPCAILWYDTDASSADKLCPVATRGLFNERALTFGTGHTADSTREALQLLGIHLRSSIKA